MKSIRSFLLVIALLIASVAFAAQDLSTVTGVKVGLGTAEYNADSTGSAVDMSNFGSAIVAISTASGTYDESNYFRFQLLECASSTGTFTEVTTDDIIGATPDASGTIYTLNAAQRTPAVVKVGYVGEMPYLKVRLDETGTATTTASVVLIGGHPRVAPVE